MKTSKEVLVTLAFFVILLGMKLIIGFEDAVFFGLAVVIAKVLKHGNG